MTLSIWRYSHFLLAVVAGVFIFLASVTGIILAFEPISKKADDYFVEEAKGLSLAEAIQAIQTKHNDIVSISVDEDDFILASLTTTEGESGEFYINPVNAEILGKPEPKAKLFEFATNLHRSLFLKSTGRFIVGLVSFLLLLIAVSGFVLVSKRQGGLKKWFSKVVYEKASTYYHVVLSRLAFIPIVIITVTGVLLSLDRFSVLPKENAVHEAVNFEQSIPQKTFSDFEIFKQTALLDISSLEFPFSPFEEDYFILKTPTEELYINQIHGGIISQAKVSSITQLVDLSLFLPTGQGSSMWAIVLGLSSLVLLILMFTGYKMAYDRIKNKKKFTNAITAQEARYILLVG
jgi:sulfite reductase (NADPH) flavoprotein alpha-component